MKLRNRGMIRIKTPAMSDTIGERIGEMWAIVGRCI
jgi:hypothetical protein